MSRTLALRINRTWPALAVVLAAGLLLYRVSTPLLTNLAMIAGAVCIAVAMFVTQMTTSPMPRDADRGTIWLVRIATGGLLLAGLVWAFAGVLAGEATAAHRDASLLLITAGAMLTLVHLLAGIPSTSAQLASIWMVSVILAVQVVVAVSLTASIPASSDFSNSSVAWAIASLTAILGLTLVIAATISLAAPVELPWYPPQAMRDQLGWLLLGASLAIQALSLVQAITPEVGWWYPALALGALLVALDRPAGQAPVHEPNLRVSHSTSNASLDARVWLAIATLGILSSVAFVWLGREPSNPRDWAIVTAAAVMLIVSATAVATWIATSTNRISRLSIRLSTLMRLSQTDSLTGLLNRRAIDDRLHVEIQRAARFNHPLAIGMIDIDDFKAVNDRFGHAAGDTALKSIASSISQELRSIDIVGRYGGEEFVMILPETDIAGAWVAADRILGSLRAAHGGYPRDRRPTTVSIGLAEFARNGRSGEELLDAADLALYQAKREGKNRAVVAEPSVR